LFITKLFRFKNFNIYTICGTTTDLEVLILIKNFFCFTGLTNTLFYEKLFNLQLTDFRENMNLIDETEINKLNENLAIILIGLNFEILSNFVTLYLKIKKAKNLKIIKFSNDETKFLLNKQNFDNENVLKINSSNSYVNLKNLFKGKLNLIKKVISEKVVFFFINKDMIPNFINFEVYTLFNYFTEKINFFTKFKGKTFILKILSTNILLNNIYFSGFQNLQNFYNKNFLLGKKFNKSITFLIETSENLKLNYTKTDLIILISPFFLIKINLYDYIVPSVHFLFKSGTYINIYAKFGKLNKLSIKSSQDNNKIDI